MAERLAGTRPAEGSASATAQDVAWAVRSASRVVPRATCLTQALAAKLVLSRRGYASRLRIGVARGPARQLRAHAWLEANGLVVVGGSRIEDFTPLAAVPADDATPRRVTAPYGGRLHHLSEEAG